MFIKIKKCFKDLRANTVSRHPCYASELRVKKCKIPEAWEVFCAPQTPSLSGLGPSPAAQRFEAAKSKRLVFAQQNTLFLFFSLQYQLYQACRIFVPSNYTPIKSGKQNGAIRYKRYSWVKHLTCSKLCKIL